MTTAELLQRNDEGIVTELAIRAKELAGLNEQQPIEMGLIAYHVKKNKLWRAGGYGGITAWMEAHFERSARTAQRNMRIVERLLETGIYTRDQIISVGSTNAFELSRIAPHILRENSTALLASARMESIKAFKKTAAAHLAKAPDHRDTEFERFSVDVIPEVKKRLLEFEATFMAQEEIPSRAEAWEYIASELMQLLSSDDITQCAQQELNRLADNNQQQLEERDEEGDTDAS